MKILFAILMLVTASVFANPIDVTCPKLTYKAAPIINADQYICHAEYAIAYSWTSRNPIYTTEFLTKDHTGDLPRTNDFRVDPAVDKMHVSTPKDYLLAGDACGPISGKRKSSCDQGHMTPDQDFSSCDICVHESFFMSNMVPQYYRNNEGIWKQMEIKIRGYAANHPAGVYVITGPSYKSVNPTTIGKNKIWVPDLLWKIMIDAKTGKSIAFMMPNALAEQNLSQFVVSISKIEAATGIKFEASLDKKTVANYAEWLVQTKGAK